LSLVLTLMVAGLGAALLARQLGASRSGSVLAAVVFAFSAFMITHVKHLNLTASAAWLPWLLFFLERYARTGHRALVAALAGVVALMFLAGHPQMAYINLGTAALLAVVLLFRGRSRRGPALPGPRPGRVRFLAGALLAVVLGTGLALPQILPTLELVQDGPRRQGLSFQEATEWDYHPAYLILFVRPFHFGDPGELAAPRDGTRDGKPNVADAATPAGFRPMAGTRNFFWEVCAYVGLLPLGLALLALWPGRRSTVAWGLLAILVVCLLLALGRHTGLARLAHDHVPGFRWFRFHGRFLLPVYLCLAVLAALGLTRLTDRIRERLAPGALIALATGALAVAICFLDLFWVLHDHNPTIAAGRWTSPPASVERIREEEQGRHEPFRIMTFDPARLVFLNAYHRAGGWKGDLTPYDVAREMVYADANLLHGLEHLDFSPPLYPEALMQAVTAFLTPDPATGTPPSARAASLLNVRYVLSPVRTLDRNPAFRWLATFPGGPEVLHGTGQPCDVHLFLNTKARPRAWLVPHARIARGGDPRAEALRVLARPDFDSRREVVILAPSDPVPDEQDSVSSAGTGDDPGQVEFVEHDPTRVRLRVETPHAAWLVLAETFDTNWRATLDGHETAVHPANLGSRAVHVPPGTHELLFTYEPYAFKLGAGLAIVAAFGVGLVLLGKRWWRRTRP
jgi:hypothetical protein